MEKAFTMFFPAVDPVVNEAAILCAILGRTRERAGGRTFSGKAGTTLLVFR